MNPKPLKLFLYLILLLVAISLSQALTLEELKSSYDFSYSGTEINATSIRDWGNDTNANGLYDYLIINITTTNQGGNYTFIGDLYYEDKYITSYRTSQWLNEGTSKIMLYFNPKLLTKTKYNLSLNINKNYMPVYRKEDAYTVNFDNTLFEKPDISANINSYSMPDTKTLRVTLAVNSTKNKAYNITGYLTGSNTTIKATNISLLVNGINTIQLNFNGSEIRKKRLNESYVYFLAIKDDNLTYEFDFNYSINYNLYDFDAGQTILADICADGLLDLNSNGLSDFLVINISIDVKDAGAYTLETALYDSYNNYVKKIINTSSLNSGIQVVEIRVNGTYIYNSKINGPYTLNYIKLMQGNATLDYVAEPCTTNISYYDDFERPSLPDLTPLNLKVNKSTSIALIKANVSNIGSSYAFIIKTSFFDQEFNLIQEKFIDYLAPNEKETVSFEYDITNITQIYAIVDYDDETGETNESNNQLSSYINRPTLSYIGGITADEADLITITAIADDPNDDILTYYINDTKFSQSANTFSWQTNYEDAGIYVVNITASDGTYSDSQTITITVLDVEVKALNISLTKGWNLVSWPLTPANKTLPGFLSSITGNYSKVFAYNNSKWLMYDPNNASVSNLNEVNEKLGFWIKMSNSDILTIQGTSPATTNFILKKGLNLIGYPSTETKPINKTLNFSFDSILKYENNSWKSYSPSKPSSLNTFSYLEPGHGYWIKLSNDINWTFNIPGDEPTTPLLITACPFVNSAETIQSDDFNRADDLTGCGSTMKGTPYINNVKGSVENNTYIVDGGGGDPCEIPAISVTGGNVSYQFNISLTGHSITGNNREISFIDYVGVLDQFAWGSASDKFCWTYSAAQVCTTNLGAVDYWYTFRFNFDADNSVFTGYWYNSSNNTLVETFGNRLDQFNIGGFGGRNWLNGDYKIDDFMMWNSTALGGGTCPRG